MGRKKKSRASTTEEDEIKMDNDGPSSDSTSLYEVFLFPITCVIRVLLGISISAT